MMLLHMILILPSLTLHSMSVMALPDSGVSSTFNSNGGRAALLSDRVLILDVDNTLYSEDLARRRSRTYGSNRMGVEEQIVANTNEFCQTNLNMTQDEVDTLFQQYGSTIEGLRQSKWLTDTASFASNAATASNQEETGHEKQSEYMEQLMKSYYDQVWPNDFDYTSITKSSFDAFHRNDGEIMPSADESGYSHVPSVPLHELLAACPYPLCFASNSPARHVQNVKRALGLCQIVTDIVTPETPRSSSSNNNSTSNDDDTTNPPFPTKANPVAFFRDLFQKYPTRRILLDDSKFNLEKACWHGVEGIHVVHSKGCGGLEEALARAMGHINREFFFSDVDYLKDKNIVDAKSIDRGTWESLAEEIALADDGILRITDLGSGFLLMLELVLNGREDKTSLIRLVSGVERVEYHAYESNVGLFNGCLDKLKALGFAQATQNEPKQGDTHVFFHADRDVVLHIHWYDYRKEEKLEVDDLPHVIIGCSFADLFQPTALVQSLMCLVGTCKGLSPLVYFPITFSGTTQFLCTHPYIESARGWIPSDTYAFSSYSKCLSEEQGHNLEPRRLVEAFERHGGELLKHGKSSWEINKEENPYFWRAMLYFFGRVAAPKLMIEGWDSVGWIERSETAQESMLVGNVDLLFRLHAKATDEAIDDDTRNRLIEIEEIQFSGPYFVETVKKDFNVDNDLLPDQVLIQSIYSLISSGTELKIYRGDFEDSTLDTNIPGMAEKRMSYPLAYGYSSVGRVVHVGSPNDSHLIGKLVFTFSPHASHVIASKDAIQFLPEGVDAKDAIFMPSVETALSLVHDAHVRLGEKVAVYGQGLIGLLVTAILAMQKTPLDSSPGGCNFGTVTTFDTIPARLAMSTVMGSSQALLPDTVSKAGPFDVSIEVSGNESALQSAIDHTRNGGRIIIGSWYGNADVALKLGIDFHRSHKTIQTSQVSEISPQLSMLWTKERRFALAWELVKLIRPSQLLTTLTTLASADAAYDSLNKGDDMAVAFKYS